jgi:hypothetical protein
MKSYRDLASMKADHPPSFILEHVEALVKNTKGEEARNPSLPPVEDDFEAWFGGAFHIAETVDDLKQIDTLVERQELPEDKRLPGADPGGWASVYETHSGMDMANYLPGREWAVLWMATSDTGGPSYFIPKSIVDQAPDNNVEKCMIDTNGEIVEENWKNGPSNP